MRNINTECYACIHRRRIQGDEHSLCARPDPGMTGNQHGIQAGWFNYPFNFDPTWKTKLCINFKETEE